MKKKNGSNRETGREKTKNFLVCLQSVENVCTANEKSLPFVLGDRFRRRFSRPRPRLVAEEAESTAPLARYCSRWSTTGPFRSDGTEIFTVRNRDSFHSSKC